MANIDMMTRIHGAFNMMRLKHLALEGEKLMA